MKITNEDLNEGEVICNKCEGGGSWPRLFLNEDQAQYYRCPKCRGAGKLDWIYNVTGVPARPGDLFRFPEVMNLYPKLITRELVGMQPMGKPKEVMIWQKVDTSWLGLRLWRRLLTIFSREKEEGGTITLRENI
ncbi:MAG: hypothetical protein ACTSX1_11670 [Candidatus Heimdallarchaeaceae archaeon]